MRMKWNGSFYHNNCHRYYHRTTSFLLVAVVLYCCFLFDNHVSCFKYLESLKRQQRQNRPAQKVPQLTLDIVQDARILPTPHGDPVPRYDFKIDDVLNFTCTIKHPSHRYKMRIVKMSKFSEDDKGIDLIDDSHDLAKFLRDQPRFSVSYDDTIYDDQNAQYIRVSLIIQNLTLSDNGIYMCKYSNITKQVNTAVYKPLHLKDINFNKAHTPHKAGASPDGKPLYEVDAPTSFSCRVAEAYPKPTIKFTHSSNVDLTQFTSEIELNKPAESETQKTDDPYYLHSLSSTLNYTIKYTDHNQNLSCQVSNSPNGTLTKTIHLDVKGVKVIENLCKDVQEVKVGAKDFILSCVYFANPRREPKLEHKTTTPAEPAKPAEAPSEDGAAAPAESAPAEDSVTTTSITAEQPGEGVTLSVEEVEPIGSGLYKAVITFAEVKSQDLKAYTFTLEDTTVTREIKLSLEDESKNQHQVNPNHGVSTTRINFHSDALVKLILFAGFLKLLVQPFIYY